MKKLPMVLLVIGVVFVLIGVYVPTVAPLAILSSPPNSGGGTGSTTGTTGTSGTTSPGPVSGASFVVSGSLAESAVSLMAGSSIKLTITVSSFSSNPAGESSVIYWDVSGVNVHAQDISSTGTWSYTYVPSAGSYTWVAKYVSAESSTSASYASFGSLSFSVTQIVNAPVINSISSSQNPSSVNASVTFTANVNWGGDTGTITWYVDDSLISGNSIVFTSAGSYTIEAVAVNSAGSATKFMTQDVSNVTLQNVGTFWYSVNDSNDAQMTLGTNMTFETHAAYLPAAFYYVFSAGQTIGASSYYISLYDINTTFAYSITFSTNNVTSVQGNTAYYLLTDLPAGSYIITGYVVPSDGSSTVNVVNSQINVVITTSGISSLVPTTNFVDIGIGVALMLSALIVWRKF